MQNIYCKQCGYMLQNGVNFCSMCGARVEKQYNRKKEINCESINIKEVILNEEKKMALVFGQTINGKNTTELYINILTIILQKYPKLVGEKESYFTEDADRATKYHGSTRKIKVEEKDIYLNTGLSTKAKWDLIDKVCKIAGVVFATEKTASVSDYTKEKVIEEYIKLLYLTFQDDIFKDTVYVEGEGKDSKKALEYFETLPKKMQQLLGFEGLQENSIRNILKEYSMDYVLYPSSEYDWNIAVSILQLFAKEGYASAKYYLGRWYGFGILRNVEDVESEEEKRYELLEEKLYLLKPDREKMVSYLTDAANNGWKEAYYDLGCYYLYHGQKSEAINHFKKAKEFGCDNAEIMLKYCSLQKNINYYCFPARSAGCGISHVNWGQYHIDNIGSVMECCGYIYYLKLEENKKSYSYCRRKIAGNHREEIINTFTMYSPQAMGLSSFEFSNFRFQDRNTFSISNGKIYFKHKFKVYSMDLDGNNITEIQGIKDTLEFSCPYAVKNGIVYSDLEMKRWYFYCFFDQSTVTLCKTEKILGISDKEVYYLTDEKREPIKVVSLEKKETYHLSDLYPSVKGKNVVFIDVCHEIVYYTEKLFNDLMCVDFPDSRILGISKNGEIVDIWERSFINENEIGGMQRQISFNGNFIAFKLLVDDYKIGRIFVFDRSGMRHHLFECKEGREIYTDLHITTENTLIFHLKEKERRSSEVECVLPIITSKENQVPFYFFDKIKK